MYLKSTELNFKSEFKFNPWSDVQIHYIFLSLHMFL